MKESKRQYFPMFFEWAGALKRLSAEQLGTLVSAIYDYADSGIAPEFADITLGLVFDLIRPQLDRTAESYSDVCSKNRENGKSGGRPAKNSHEDESLTDTNVETENPATIDDNSENPTDVNDNVENAENPVGYLGYDENPVGTNETKRNQMKRSDTNRSTGDDAAASARPRTVFVKPSADEIAAYCSESGYPVDAERFLAYYDSNGWMVGRNHMKDWRAAIRTWSARDKAMPDKPNSAMPDYTPPPDGVSPWA